MEKIVRAHFDALDETLLRQSIEAFYRVRALHGLQKKPSTSELIDWLQALTIGGIDPARIESELPFAGVLLKKNEDLAVLDRERRVSGGWRR